jgi:outer membrane receptor protein involved in Fe transport
MITRPRRRRALYLGLAVALLARLGSAQDEPRTESTPQDETPRFESEVRVEAEPPAAPPPSTAATRVPVAVEDLPISVVVVPEHVFEEQAARVVGDALKNVSGVNVATGFGVFDFFVIRGFDSLTSGLVLTDGIAEPEATSTPSTTWTGSRCSRVHPAFSTGAIPSPARCSWSGATRWRETSPT